MDCFLGDDNLDDDSDFELDIIIHGDYSKGDMVVLLATCRSQAVTIKIFTARQMEQWGTQGFLEPLSSAQTQTITLLPRWLTAML